MRRGRLRRLALALAVLLAANVAGGVAALRLIYRRFEGADHPLPEGCRPMAFPSGSATLQGYYFESEKGLVLLVPGFHSVALDYLPVIAALNARGWAVFAFDATGTGRSGGDDQRGFPQILRDARAARDFLMENDRLGHGALMLLGHSRGAYGAAGALDGTDGAALVSGVNSAMEAQTQPLSNLLALPAAGTWPVLWAVQALEFGADARFDAAAALAGSDIPALVIQGTGDTTAPPALHSLWAHRAEFDRAGVELLALEGGHTDVLCSDGAANDAAVSALCDFFDRCAGK